eukprot:g2011.t1
MRVSRARCDVSQFQTHRIRHRLPTFTKHSLVWSAAARRGCVDEWNLPPDVDLGLREHTSTQLGLTTRRPATAVGIPIQRNKTVRLSDVLVRYSLGSRAQAQAWIETGRVSMSSNPTEAVLSDRRIAVLEESQLLLDQRPLQRETVLLFRSPTLEVPRCGGDEAFFRRHQRVEALWRLRHLRVLGRELVQAARGREHAGLLVLTNDADEQTAGVAKALFNLQRNKPRKQLVLGNSPGTGDGVAARAAKGDVAVAVCAVAAAPWSDVETRRIEKLYACRVLTGVADGDPDPSASTVEDRRHASEHAASFARRALRPCTTFRTKAKLPRTCGCRGPWSDGRIQFLKIGRQGDIVLQFIFTDTTHSRKYDLYYLLSKASGCLVSAVLFYFLYQEDFSIKKAEIRFIRWFRTLPLYPPPKATIAVRNSTVGSDVLEKFGSAETIEALQEWFLLKDAKLEKGVTRDEVLIFLEEGAQITKDTDLVCRQFLRQQGDGDRSNEKCRLLGVALEEFLRFVADVLETNFRLADDDQKEQEAALRRAAGKGVREMTLSGMGGAGGLGMGAVLGRGGGAAGPGAASAAFAEDDVSIAHTLQFEKARLEEMIESMEAKGAALNVSQRRQLESAKHELGKVNEDLAMNK